MAFVPSRSDSAPALWLAALLLSVSLPVPGSTRAVSESSARLPSGLTTLEPRPKCGERYFAGPLTSTVCVKFREGCDVRPQGDALGFASGFGAGEAADLVNEAAVRGGVRPTFEAPGEAIRVWSKDLSRASGVALADLSLYVDVRTESPEAAARLAARLDALDEVETAYARPVPAPPPSEAAGPDGVHPASTAAPTPDFTYLQHYLDPAPRGLGIKPVRALLGEGRGRGAGVRIVDIQYSWYLDHEDLPFDPNRPETYKELFPNERRVDRIPKDQGNHGTASLGMLVASENAKGVSGICPAADVGIINPNDETTGEYKLAAAIYEATLKLDRDSGDIIQIEQQAPAINNTVLALPVEFKPDVYMAIKAATAAGLIVVEPAGNGSSNLDKAKGINGQFDRARFDSGAIMVGAGNPPLIGYTNASRVKSSNCGSRVDVQGQGLFVATTGYAGLWGKKGKRGDPAIRYTDRFGGTSSATACVTGAAAIVQGFAKESGLAPISPALMRSLLAGTGSVDLSPVTSPIGPRPDALKAVRILSDPSKPFINDLEYQSIADRLVIDGIFFVPDRSVVEITVDGVTQTFPAQAADPVVFERPDGTTRLTVGPGIAAFVPLETVVTVAVVTPGATPEEDIRSEIEFFKRR
jgi:serine protease